MRRFAALYRALDASSGANGRVAALVAFFGESEPADAAWALHVLLGKQGRRLITGRRLREICLEGSPLPDWLFDDCYAHVGDSAETIALLWLQVAAVPAAAPLRAGRILMAPCSNAACSGCAVLVVLHQPELQRHGLTVQPLPAACRLATPWMHAEFRE